MITTYLNRINHTKYGLKEISFDNIYNIIKDGTLPLYDGNQWYTLKDVINFIMKSNPKERQKLKLQFLPAIAYNGIFTEVNSSGLKSYSCITALDFDHIGNNNALIHLRNRLIKTPCVKCVFTTPSGEGLKAIVMHDNTNPNNHRDMYEQLLDKFNVASKDISCKDIARRNYLSYDPNIWVNNNVIPFHYVPSTTSVKNCFYSGKSVTRTISDKSIISIMNKHWKNNYPNYWSIGNRANSIFKLACLMCKWGIDESLAEEYFVKNWEDDTMTEEEIVGHVGRAYIAESNNFGTLDFELY